MLELSMVLVTVLAIDRSSFFGFEGNLGLFSAIRTGCVMHISGLSGATVESAAASATTATIKSSSFHFFLLSKTALLRLQQ